MSGTPASGEFANQYLIVDLAGLPCGLPVLPIRELLGLRPLVPIPHNPPFLRGALSLRGRSLPIVDLRTRFALPAALSDRTCIVVVALFVSADSILEFGLVVDAVTEVVSIAGTTVAPLPDSHPILDRAALLGQVTLDRGPLALLDLGGLFAPDVALALARQAALALASLPAS